MFEEPTPICDGIRKYLSFTFGLVMEIVFGLILVIVLMTMIYHQRADFYDLALTGGALLPIVFGYKMASRADYNGHLHVWIWILKWAILIALGYFIASVVWVAKIFQHSIWFQYGAPPVVFILFVYGMKQNFDHVARNALNFYSRRKV